MRTLEARGLSANPLDASARFNTEFVPAIRAVRGATVTVVFDPADHTHTGWRLAAIQSLARERVPDRINAIVSSDPAAIAAALAYLDRAPGVTGQLLPLDGQGAGIAAG